MTPDAPSDPPNQFVSVRGHQVAYTDIGTGPIIVAIHGLPGDATDFRWLGPAIEPNARFIRLNLPGFGGSPAAAGSLRWPDPPQFVAEVLDALNLQDVTLLGHSYGTLIATHGSLLSPTRVSRLALLAPLGLRRHKGFDNFPSARLTARALRLPIVGSALLRPIHRSFRAAGFRKPLEDEHIRRTIDAVATWAFPPYREATKQLNVPVFGAYCEDDHLIQAEIMSEFLDACPKGPRMIFPKGGHNLQKTRAIEVGEGLLKWLRL